MSILSEILKGEKDFEYQPAAARTTVAQQKKNKGRLIVRALVRTQCGSGRVFVTAGTIGWRHGLPQIGTGRVLVEWNVKRFDPSDWRMCSTNPECIEVIGRQT